MYMFVALVQVYFVDDPYEPEWKVVRYKNPRSRRVVDSLSQSSLSAPGRLNATQILRRDDARSELEAPAIAELVLRADIQHVEAHEENDDDAAYDDMDLQDVSDEEEEPPPEEVPVNAAQLDEAIDDA